jgi:progranulin
LFFFPFSSQAVCCSDKAHCCPQGTTCNVAAGTCNRGDDVIRLAAKLETNPAVKNVPCPDGTFCQDGNTCCQLASGNYGCCPYVQVNNILS